MSALNERRVAVMCWRYEEVYIQRLARAVVPSDYRLFKRHLS